MIQWNSIQNPGKTVCRYSEADSKIMERHKVVVLSKQLWEKEKEGGELVPLDFQTYFKAMTIKTLMGLAKRSTYRSRGRTECLQINPHVSAQLILTKVQRLFVGGRYSFQQMFLEQWDVHMQENKHWHIPNILYQI